MLDDRNQNDPEGELVGAETPAKIELVAVLLPSEISSDEVETRDDGPNDPEPPARKVSLTTAVSPGARSPMDHSRRSSS